MKEKQRWTRDLGRKRSDNSEKSIMQDRETRTKEAQMFRGPRGASFDLNTSYCVYVEKKGSSIHSREAAFGIEAD